MPRIPLTWLGEHVELPSTASALEVATDLSRVGLEEEALFGAQVTGPLVVGRVLELVKEPQKNGKTINWVRVDVGPEHNEDADDPKDPQPGQERPSRGIICGAHNFVEGDLVVVSLPGTVLPGDFAIAARKTYGHTSDGMICSGQELGLSWGPDVDGEDGIIVLGRGHAKGLTGEPGDDAIALLGLADEVVEINVTPDRGYCFSMRGVAREYGHATGAAFADPAAAVEITATEAGGAEGVGVELADDSPLNGAVGCTRFVALEVTGVDPSAQTPRWMARRLTLAGMRPISLIVDVTNYVMLDLGQPLHAYDAAKLEGPIVVRRARPGEELTTLDDVERTLDPEDLLITDSEGAGRVLGLAGVMGGEDTEVSSATTAIVLEAATFDPVSVARTARRHRLPSEASKRFERGVDPELPLIAAHRAAQLIVEHGGGTVSARVTDEGAVSEPAPITAGLRDAERIVGIGYTEEQVVSSLEAIGCTVEREGEDGLVVTPPSWRPDLTIREDLVEEIARLIGYAEIPSILPTAPGGRGLTVAQRSRRAARRALAEAGLVEVNSAPFVAPAVHDRLRYAQGDARREAVRILNPLAEDEPLLRTELLQSLLPVARRNLGRGEESVAIFQRGSVFRARAGESVAPVPVPAQRPSDQEMEQILAALPVQTGALAAVVGGASGPDSWQGDPAPWGWADALDLARRAAAAVGAELEVRQREHAPFHPGRAAELRVLTADGNGLVVGAAGELHPAVLKEFGLPARTAAFELDLEAVIAAAPSVVRAVPVPSYPAAKEDFAFVVEETVPASVVEAAIVVGAGDLAERVHLFDVFTGEQIGEGRKSLAFAIRLRSTEGTLTAEQIGETRSRIVAAVETAVGGVLRA